MSRVDVVIPCYNYGRYLRDCVASVLSQDGVDVRLLIIDDASPDQTAEVAAELAARDSRVEFLRHPVNRGHISTYNEGLLEWVTADYCLLLSADDLITPGSLCRAAGLMDANPKIGLTFGRQIAFSGDVVPPTPAVPGNDLRCRIYEGPDFLSLSCATGSNIVATPTVIVRTALQKKVGGYRNDLLYTGDLEMWMRFAAHGPVAELESYQAYKRMHGRNMQCAYVVKIRGELEERMAAFDTFLRDYGYLLPDADRLRRSARDALAGEAFWAASSAFENGDVSQCKHLLEFAVTMCPALASRREWSRLRWKQRVGPRMWSALRPLIEWLRGQPRAFAS